MAFEKLERQDEILALLKMMQYVEVVADDIEVPQATFHIRAAYTALLSVLEREYPMVSKEHLVSLIGRPQRHCGS